MNSASQLPSLRMNNRRASHVIQNFEMIYVSVAEVLSNLVLHFGTGLEDDAWVVHVHDCFSNYCRGEKGHSRRPVPREVAAELPVV
jgi:hypothetical protein